MTKYTHVTGARSQGRENNCAHYWLVNKIRRVFVFTNHNVQKTQNQSNYNKVFDTNLTNAPFKERFFYACIYWGLVFKLTSPSYCISSTDWELPKSLISFSAWSSSPTRETVCYKIRNSQSQEQFTETNALKHYEKLGRNITQNLRVGSISAVFPHSRQQRH